MNTLERARWALIRAKIELECANDPSICKTIHSRRFIRDDVLHSIAIALEMLDTEITCAGLAELGRVPQ
jgi:hypothetical protein